MNAELRKKAKNYFEKHFFKLINNLVFGKIMEFIQLVTIEKRTNCLVSEPNYYTTKFWQKSCWLQKLKKETKQNNNDKNPPQKLMNKPVTYQHEK